MTRLDLRSRLLVAFGLLAALQVAVAFVIITLTHDHLLDQIDDRLTIAVPLERAGGLNRPPPPLGTDDTQPERLGDTYEGRLGPDGTLVTIFAPNSTGTDLAPPGLDLAQAEDAAAEIITVDADDGDFRYRLTAVLTENGDYFVTAVPLVGVDSTMSRLTMLVWSTVVIVTLAVGLITWWVLRLGIDPIKRMTRSAEAIADGDLSERISDVDPRTEAGQLGHALNTMLGRIETSFDERRRAEDRLRQFIADASHELRTPVATIRGYAELYQHGGLDDAAALDDAMRRTEQESQRMSRLIADMLRLAKLDRDPTLATGPADLTAIASDTVADARVTHPERRITADIADEPLVVEGDDDLLRQALANLVGNAVVHTDPTAAVRLDVERSGANAVVRVIDDGAGMAPDVVERVTERFYRADASRSRHQGGSGLGLAIVDTVVDAHHGSLVIDSIPGSGTTVTIELPLAEA